MGFYLSISHETKAGDGVEAGVFPSVAHTAFCEPFFSIRIQTENGDREEWGSRPDFIEAIGRDYVGERGGRGEGGNRATHFRNSIPLLGVETWSGKKIDYRVNFIKYRNSIERVPYLVQSPPPPQQVTKPPPPPKNIIKRSVAFLPSRVHACPTPSHTLYVSPSRKAFASASVK